MFNNLTCTRCGTEYSTDRELPLPGSSPERCPSCGTKNQPAKADGGTQTAGHAGTSQQPAPATTTQPAGGAPPGEVAVHVDAELWRTFVTARDPGDTIEDAIQTWLHE